MSTSSGIRKDTSDAEGSDVSRSWGWGGDIEAPVG